MRRGGCEGAYAQVRGCGGEEGRVGGGRVGGGVGVREGRGRGEDRESKPFGS